MNSTRRVRIFVAAAATIALLAPIAARSAPVGAWKVISTKAPAWMTEELQARIMASGLRGVRVPSAQIPAATSLAFLGIRPGQLLIVHNGPGAFSVCTSNFVFHNGANYAIGTAGHCGSVGNSVSMIFAPGIIKSIGAITKSTGDAGIGNDFALISIKPAFSKIVSPSMAFWGGPTGIYGGPGAPLFIKHIGWGVVIGTGGTPRVAIGTFWSTTKYYFVGTITPGDSGSAADTGSNQALGNITHLLCCIDADGLHTSAGTSIQRILQIAGLPLATCKSAKPWPLYGCPPL